VVFFNVIDASFCFSRTVTGDGIYHDEVNWLTLAFHHLGRDEIHARSNPVSHNHMLWAYRHRNRQKNMSAADKKAIYKHNWRLLHLRRKALADEIIAKLNSKHLPTFDQVNEYCTEREWRDANTLKELEMKLEFEAQQAAQHHPAVKEEIVNEESLVKLEPNVPLC
jgi:hypothetical protein